MSGVVIVVPFWHTNHPARRDIMSRVFHHLATVDATVLGIGSEHDLSLDLFTEHHDADAYREYDQTRWPDDAPPWGHDGLRDKFNTGIEHARDYNPDYVFICGSDDLMPAGLFVPSDSDLVGPGTGPDGGCYFWQYQDRHEAWWWAGRTNVNFTGGVLGFSSRLLDYLGWRPFQWPHDEIGVEDWVVRHPEDWTIEARYGMPGWHPKCDAVLNTFGAVRGAHDLFPADDETFANFLTYWDALA